MPVVSLLTEVFTPRRDGRRSLPLRANVRVGPPAMSSSIRSFSPTAFLRFDKPLVFVNETVRVPKTSLQVDSEGAFFSSESAEKNRTGWFGQSMTSKFKLQSNPDTASCKPARKANKQSRV